MLVFLHPPSIRTYCFANIRSLTACFLIKWSWEGELVQRECMATRLHIRRDIPSVSAVRKERETKPVVVGITRWSKLMKIFPAKIETFSYNSLILHTKFILFILFLLLYLYCTRNIDCSWKIFLGEKLVIFRSGQMVNDRGGWGGEVWERSTRRVGGVLFLRKAI